MLPFHDSIAVTTVGELLLQAVAVRPNGDAIVFPDERRSYAALAEAAIDRARALLALGIAPGDHVGLLLPSSVEYLEVFFATALIGAVAVPINARYRAFELRHVVTDGDLALVVTTDRVTENVNFVERLTEAFPSLARCPVDADLALPEAPRLRRLLLLSKGQAPGFTSWAAAKTARAGVDASAVYQKSRAVAVRDIALMLYTSGTTAHPKGCLISHEALVRNAQALAQRYRMTAADRFWSPLPMFHIGALFPICATFAVEATYLAMHFFDAGTALSMIERERATVTYPCFGTFIADMIFHPDFPKRDLSSVRLMNSNLAMQPETSRDALREKLPQSIQVGTYGMTETTGTVTTSCPEDSYEERTTRLGRPLEGLAVKILREDGSEATAGEIGEIVVRGFSLFSGYYKDPEKTVLSMQDGWFRTGDLGSLDASGTLMFHGRLKDMLKVGGENVAALEIETLVGSHPAVKLCQVIGKPDRRLQEVPVAFVELKPGCSATEEEIVAFCRGKIAAFKIPRAVVFVSEWPMSASKIQKFRLRELLP